MNSVEFYSKVDQKSHLFKKVKENNPINIKE